MQCPKDTPYNALIVPIATYASETWTLRSSKTRRFEVFEMRCLRAILGVTRRERLRNEHIRKALQMKDTIAEVAEMVWPRHKTPPTPESYVAKAYREDLSNPRTRGRPPKKWITQVREDTGSLLLPHSAKHWTVVIGVQ